MPKARTKARQLPLGFEPSGGFTLSWDYLFLCLCSRFGPILHGWWFTTDWVFMGIWDCTQTQLKFIRNPHCFQCQQSNGMLTLKAFGEPNKECTMYISRFGYEPCDWLIIISYYCYHFETTLWLLVGIAELESKQVLKTYCWEWSDIFKSFKAENSLHQQRIQILYMFPNWCTIEN